MLVDYLQRRFDRAGPGGEPDHRRLYRVLQEGILRDEVQPGTRLPSSRQLATELGIARNTVIHVYEQLGVEGYVSAGVGSGTFVADTAPDRLDAAPAPAPAPAPAASITEAATPAAPMLSTRGRALVRDAGASSRQWGAFMPGVPEVRMFPARIWSRLHNRLLRKPSPALLTYPVGAGYLPLRTALADYLRTARGVRCEPEQIIITAGIHPSLQLIAQLLCDAGDSAWIEDPGYWGVRSVLTAAGVRTVPLPVDDEGMRFDIATRGRQRAKPPKLMVVSPSHQYPLGSVMSLARRRALLATAHATDAWIVEDDYDSEFRYGSRPLPSLQGLDEGGRVLYMGTFSKVLFPSLRIGYLVVPPALADAFATGLSEMFRGGQILTQAVLADFIAEGHFVSHIRRMRGVYAERRETLLDAIRTEFGEALPVHDGASGLHLVLGLPEGTNDVAVAERALANDVVTRPLTRYYQDDTRRQPGLLLGYGHVETEAIAARFSTLAEAIRAQWPDGHTM
ncbi:PLP-dependent aminotransferase family protein [uncultured Ralstonia sp.]|uniref:MocR-like pyridoxine biosynthesis transcription factor PdxR n=1 Tax=Ralstonia sp. TaxID=54061 RepID=UPI001EA63F82|nr:PLP-dependent aminotransferase family protein [uncultured Ralstonia sp.]UCF26302.1 MAG: PLP-dependent aminotransferase family protein [Ralstonia sp.]